MSRVSGSPGTSTGSRSFQAVLAGFTGITVMIASLVSAAPAWPLDPFDPDEPATWKSSPYSPLDPADLIVANNKTRLTFEEGTGLPATDGRGTGFTLLQPSTADDGGPFYVPADLRVASGFLHVTASSGSTLLDSNAQDNALGVGLVPDAATIRISATVNAPQRMQPATEAGLWFGPNDDNLVRLFLTGSDAAGMWEMNLRRERDGVSGATPQDLISVPLSAVPKGQSLKLVLDVDPAAEAVLAAYQVGTGAPVSIGRMEIPANFLDGTLLPESGVGGAKSLAGIFASASGESARDRSTLSFDDFTTEDLPAAANPAPAPPTKKAEPTAEPGTKPPSSPAADPGQLRSPLPSPPPSAPPSASPPTSPAPSAGPIEAAPAPSGSLPATRPTKPASGGPASAPAAPATGAGPANRLDASPPAKDALFPETGCLAGEWRAEYFSGTSLAGSPVVTGCFAEIDQAFPPGDGPEGVGAEQYSARWVKVLQAGAGDYAFTARADDGVRITVDGEPVIDKWEQETVDVPHTAELSLDGGRHVVAVEYFQAGGAASVHASYSKDGADTEPPIPASGLTTRGGPSAVNLSWKASGSKDVAGYRVYRGTRHGVDVTVDPLSGTEPLTGTSFSDSSARADTTYYYTVVALDAAGNDSVASNEAAGSWATLEAADVTPPPAPSGLTAVSGDTKVGLTWTAPAAGDIAGYRVYRSLQPVVEDTGSLHSGTALVTGTTYEDTTAVNGTTYFYVVSAVDLSGNESAKSNEVHAVPVVPNTTNIRVDFTVTSGVPAPGYTADWGQSFSARTGPNQGTGFTYGWKTPDGNPLSLVGNGRDRGRAGIDERLDSIIHMQYGDDPGTNGVKTEGIWEASVPDGLYQVTVAVGDQAFSAGYNSVHAINVEAGVGIEKFQGSAAKEYQTTTVIVGVWDGALSITAAGGTNTKLAYIDIVGLERAPHIDTMRPDNRSTGQDPTDGVSATIRVPYAGVGVDASTLPGNVHIYEVATGSEVPSSTGTSGGNDVIATQPASPLKPDTTYRFTVTSSVKDNYGASFIPFTSIFTTGNGGSSTGTDYTPLTGVSFTKIEQPVASGMYWSSMAFGPDGKLYASTIGQGLFRFTVAPDGSLSARENLGYAGRAIIGLVFDKTGSAASPKLWITSTSANTFNEQGEWISGVSMLSGPALQTESRVFTGLPRSQADHLTNSMAYGPDGRLYFMQGSNQGAGDLDNSWGQRGEKLLTAAALVFDPAHPAVQQAISTGTPINVQTSGGGTYSPYSQGAPLKIYATGIRNAYDLVWHSNGHLYVPTNGTAGGANSPGVIQNSNGTFTRVAAEGIPGYSSVNGQDVTAQCVRRGYNGGTVPAIGNQPTQRDFLFDVVDGGYYGHPNPERCEWVLNEGNDPLNPPTGPGQGGSKYPSGTKADPNYRGFSYDFGFNKSPNGSVEYKSSTFGGQLKGRLIVTRFSNNNDLLFLQVDPATGKVLGEQTSLGINGVPNSAIGGVDGFNDPLEVVEDPKTGNLYVNQYDRSGSNQAMFLLKVPSEEQAAPLTSSVPEMIFSAVKSTTGPTKSVTITNTGSASATLSTSVAGANPAEFTFSGGNGTTLSPGASTTIQATFKPGTTVGQRQAVLRITAAGSTLDVGLYGLTMNGIEGLNEPPFQDVAGTLGHKINVGWSNLEGGTQATAKGDELLEPLFLKAGTQPVSMVPLAQFAPKEDLPFGWYTGDGTPAQLHKLGSIDIAGYQSLLPPVSPGTLQTFDPGTQSFGFYYYSNAFQRTGYTEDRLNAGGVAHRARIYPAKNRTGGPMANSFIVAFEDASNGDYQDYVFLVQGVRPASGGVTPPASGSFKVNFSNLAAGLPTGYFRDFGEPFGARTRTDQGTGLSYGWKNQSTGSPIDLSTAGTAGPGNGRLRSTTQPDLRLNTLMHMQGADVPSFNGVSAYAYWEAAVPNGDYDVTVAVGDPAPQTATELHTINLEGRKIIDRFAPSGASGSDTRHQTAATRVTVTDGLLTVDAQGGINTKIDYIDVVPAPTDPGGDPTVGAQVKVNFQTSGAPTPAGWVPDTGAAFLAQRKFGWLVGTTPTDRSSAARHRTAATAGIAYPSDPLLQTLNIIGPASNVSTGVWEYAVPDGTYTVAASAGDAGYLDSTHGILAEGQPLIASFVPTGTAPFQTGARQVTVADGKLTLSSNGTNTKINWVSIKGAALDTQPDSVPTAKYNFTLPSAVTPTGWIADYGGMYDGDGYGWFVNGTPADRTLEARNRPSATAGITYPSGDPLLQSLVQMQTASKGGTDGTWQRAIPNGTYEVTASVGDAGYLDSVHALNVEGTQLVAPFTPTGTSPFASGTATVDISDGKLTLTPTGTNTKINWVTIKGPNLLDPVIPADTTAPASPAGLTATAGTSNVTLNWTANTEPDLAGYHVERATTATGPWTRLTGTTPVPATTYTDTTPPAASALYYRILAIDTSANTSTPSAAAQVNTTNTTQATRINTGGPAVTTGGLNWLADTYFTGGKTYSNPLVTQISGTTDDSLYLNERSGKTSFGYAIPVPSGNYTVKLHFAELWHGATGGGPGGTGKRIFTVNLEAGTPEITNLDLNAIVAPMTAHIRTHQLNVTDGTLNIDFTATTDEPTIAAIEIIPG